MRSRMSIISIFLLLSNFLTAQKLTNNDYTAYINKYKSIAIREMQLFKIPASITLAQGMIESGCGKSVLALETKNHFGIKCQNDWPGDTYYYDDDKENECFRKYNNVDESYRDHSLFLTTRKRYSQLFALTLTDYRGWATGLKQAGYATNPDYPNILIRLIEANKLYLLDDTLLLKDETNLRPNESNRNKIQIETEVNDSHKPAISNNEGRIIFRKNYIMPIPSDYEYSYTSDENRKVYQNCGVPFIFAKKGDTWYGIAKEFGIFSYQVYKQNDLLESDPITIGQMIYLEHKKKKNSEKTYEVKKGDSIYSVSQQKCIILSRLLKYNKLKPGDEPGPGFELKLTRQSIF
jgi:LysM repeat protein